MEDQQPLEQPNVTPPTLTTQTPQYGSTVLVSPPQKSPRSKKKLVIILIALILIILLLGGISWLLLVNKDTDTPGTPQSSNILESAPEANTPLRKIDAELAQYRITDDNVMTPNSAGTEVELDFHIFSYDDTGRFKIGTNKEVLYYQFPTNDGASCEEYNSSFGSSYNNAKKYFTDASYIVKEVDTYAQYDDCAKTFIANNDREGCFVRFSDASDVTGKLKNSLGGTRGVLAMQAGCLSDVALADDRAEANEAHAARAEAGLKDRSGQNPGTQFIDGILYVKDSVTSGYRIASISAGPYNIDYLYKSTGGKWTTVGDSPEVLECEQSTEVRKAFLGENCGSITVGTNGPEPRKKIVL